MVVTLNKIFPQVVVVVISSWKETKKFIVVTAEHVDFAIENNNRVSSVLAQPHYKLVLHIELYIHHSEYTVNERDVYALIFVFENNILLDSLGEAREQNVCFNTVRQLLKELLLI